MGRKVQLNILGLQEVREIVLQNMERIGNNDSFEYKTNNVIVECISKYERRHKELPTETIEEIETIEKLFISKGNENLLPIPVLSDTCPHNPIHFLFMLSFQSASTIPKLML